MERQQQTMESWARTYPRHSLPLVWEAFYGNGSAARQRAARVLELGQGRDVDYAAAFALMVPD
jgi:hypothetical protein